MSKHKASTQGIAEAPLSTPSGKVETALQSRDRLEALAATLELGTEELTRTWERAKLRGGPDAMRTASAVEWVRRLVELEARRMGRPLLGPEAAVSTQRSAISEPAPSPSAEQQREDEQRALARQRLGQPALVGETDPGPVTPYEKAVTRERG
jgi:hypothetical protein